MGKKTVNVNVWLFFLIDLIVVCGTTIGGYLIGAGGSVDEINRLNREYDRLNREYSDRQRAIEAGVDRCIGIIERTEANTSGAISNLRAAIELIKQGSEENKSLKSELNNIRASLYSSGNMDRVSDKE